MRGGDVIVTVNVHVSVRCFASVAVHVTVVVPTGKLEPLAGAHAVVTGGAPNDVVAGRYSAGTGWPSGEGRLTGAGHEIFGGSGTTGGGGVGVG